MPNRLGLTVLCCIFYATPHLLSIPFLRRNTGSLRPEVTNVDVFNAENARGVFLFARCSLAFWELSTEAQNISITELKLAYSVWGCSLLFFPENKGIKFKLYRTMTVSNYLIVSSRATMCHFSTVSLLRHLDHNCAVYSDKYSVDRC